MAGMDSIKPNGRPFTFSKQSEDHLQTVVPSLQAVARRALALTKVDFTIISGRRDMAEQRRLVRQWVSRTLHYRHLTGHALDLVPLDPATGKGRFSRDLAIEVAVAFHEAGYQLHTPIRWGGMWAEFEDIPHVEIPDSGARKL
ncbi:MAG: M15 family metallopeptidase [Candidatus Puniceispirillales bacterium]